MNKYYGSGTSLVDLVFNCLLTFICMFVLAFLLMNPIAKQEDIKAHAEFLIVLEWDNESDADIDIWVRSPNGNNIHFRQKDIDGIFLDRDDLGHENDTFIYKDGSIRSVKLNREVVSIRGFYPGDYTVNVHAYNIKKTEDVKVTIIKINPYLVIAEKNISLKMRYEEATAFNFTITEGGQVININSVNNPFIR